MKHRLYPSFLVAAAFMLLFVTAARAATDTETSTLKFSDPAKPGTLKVSLSHGDIRIRGTDAAEITVKSEAKPITSTPRKDGLRVLTASSSFTFTEKDNVALLDYGRDNWGGGDSDFDITVPRSTAIVIASNLGSDVRITDVSGDVEIKTLNGDVVLDGLGGGALVETMNGEIKASFTQQLPAGKPLSFSSMNGEIAIRVPAEAKANVRLRTQNGSILTDFDDKALITKTESLPVGRSVRSRTSLHTSSKSAVPATPAVTATAIPAPPTAPMAPTAPMPPTAPIPPTAPVVDDDKSDSHDAADREAMREDMREAAREAARASAEAGRAIAEATRVAVQVAHNAMAEGGMMSHGVSFIPPMTGGKLVTGTLNGGGPEIMINTMNGDVTLRKLK
jgi:Putative adhesin